MVWGNSLVHFLIWSPLISLQPRSFTASWSTWHGYLCSSEVERRGGWGGAELKVMQEAFRPLLWASTAGNSPGSLGAGLQLTEATRWKTTTYQEAPTWQMELERGQNSDCGNESISAFCFSSKSLPPLQAWAALAGLSTLTFSLGSIIMVVNGCQVCGCFVFFFFSGGGGEKLFIIRVRSSGLCGSSGSPETASLETIITRIIPNLRLSALPLPSLLDVQPCGCFIAHLSRFPQ